MRVFLSWSGEKSKQVADSLRELLPLVINELQPFVSSKDISSGTRWQSEVAKELEASNFGIVCVTRDNQNSTWLNFEAGALAKVVESSRLVPLAVDLKVSDIGLPIGQFQSQPASRIGLQSLLISINKSLPTPLPDRQIEKALDLSWPDFEAVLAGLVADVPQSDTIDSVRSERDLLEEVLNTVRSVAQAHSLRRPDASIASVEDGHPLLDQIRKVLVDAGEEPRPVLSSLRSRAVVIIDGFLLPLPVRTEIQQLAALYGAEVRFANPNEFTQVGPISEHARPSADTA